MGMIPEADDILFVLSPLSHKLLREINPTLHEMWKDIVLEGTNFSL